MKKILLLFVVVLVQSPFTFCQTDQKDFPILKGPYLGQKPPSSVAKIFAPGIISKMNHEIICGFFNNGSLFIYKSIPVDFDDDADLPVPIYITQLKNNIWTKPMLTKKLGEPWFHNLNSISLNETFYYADWLRDDTGKRIDLDIFREYKTKLGWSHPERLNYPVNTDEIDSWPSISNNGTLYFFSNRNGGIGKCDIYRSIIENGTYRTVENLGELVNTDEHDHDPIIDPDENYLIFNSNRRSGFGEDDLYISFRTKDGTWSKAINMGKDVNSKYEDNRPYITPDRKYLFFTRFIDGNLDIYWVSTKIFEELKPKEIK